MLNRVLYLGYYLKQLDKEKFKLFLNHACKESGKSKAIILADLLKSIFAFNISILEYFQFGFYKINEVEKRKWAGTGYMYEYQLRMNPKSQRQILDDKTRFYKIYGKYFVHRVADIQDLKETSGIAEEILNSTSGKLVFKEGAGKCGKGVEVRSADEFTTTSLLQHMQENGFDLVEEFIIQHEALNRLSPAAVNTVRVFTQLNEKGEVDILGCRQRISVTGTVDNMAAGNMAASIDESTGIVDGPGVYSDITKEEEIIHPITGVAIQGFQVPFWQETMLMVKEAALLHPENRSIGWDVVITDKGPGLIEGNHDWCKLLWQLPVKNGLKHLLEKY